MLPLSACWSLVLSVRKAATSSDLSHASRNQDHAAHLAGCTSGSATQAVYAQELAGAEGLDAMTRQLAKEAAQALQ